MKKIILIISMLLLLCSCKKKENTIKELTITEMNRAIKIIDFVLAPHQIIIIGPKATLGKLFKIVR